MRFVPLFVICGMVLPHLLDLRAGEVSGGGDGTLVLSGNDWRLTSCEPGDGRESRVFADGYPMAETVPAIVPGDVHWDLERAGKIPPIYYGTNSARTAWIAAKDWWYRKTFRVPTEWQNKTIRLQFDGVDYLADVWLNGRHLGGHEGQFTPFEFDVGDVLNTAGENVLTVQVHAAPELVREAIARDVSARSVMQAIRSAYPYWKCMTNAGWDWGAKIITMGIWKDVRLVESEDVVLKTPIIFPELDPPYDCATLRTRLSLETPKACSVELRFAVRCLTAQAPLVHASKRVTLSPGTTEVREAIDLAHPQLWWPNGYGEPHRYAMEVSVWTPEGSKELARAGATFGIRDLKMLQNPESPDNTQYVDWPTWTPVLHDMPSPPPPRKYLIQINGRKIFARGGNWLPCDLLYGRPRRPVYEHLIRLAADANYNLLRVWGGGLIDKPEFFDLCDEYGIMLYQEFPNAGPRLPETEEALAIAARETREILPVLMNHPCIVRYGAGNEQYRDASNSRQMAQLRSICNEIDPTRPYHDPDPETIAQRHAPHSYWYLSHYRTYNTGFPMHSGPDNPLEWTEYGASGASSVETLQSIMPASALWPIDSDNPYWRWHKAFHAYGPDNWLGSEEYLRLFGPLPDLETTVRSSQFVQAEGLRYANQSMRRFRWHRSGCVSWTFNEPWPNAAHGSIVEYAGRPKMAYYYTKSAFAAVDVMAVYSTLEAVGRPVPIDLWVVNDHMEPLKGYRCRYRVTDLSGQVLADESLAAEVAAEGQGCIGSVQWSPHPKLGGGVVLLWLELFDATDQQVVRHLYTFGVPAGAREQRPLLAALLKAPRTTLNVAVVSHSRNSSGETDLTLRVSNTGNVPALFVKAAAQEPVEANPGPSKSRGVYFADNYVSMFAGETRLLCATLTRAAPTRVTFCIDAWNADDVFTQTLP